MLLRTSRSSRPDTGLSPSVATRLTPVRHGGDVHTSPGARRRQQQTYQPPVAAIRRQSASRRPLPGTRGYGPSADAIFKIGAGDGSPGDPSETTQAPTRG